MFAVLLKATKIAITRKIITANFTTVYLQTSSVSYTPVCYGIFNNFSSSLSSHWIMPLLYRVKTSSTSYCTANTTSFSNCQLLTTLHRQICS